MDMFVYLLIYFLNSPPLQKLDIAFLLLSYSTEHVSTSSQR